MQSELVNSGGEPLISGCSNREQPHSWCSSPAGVPLEGARIDRLLQPRAVILPVFRLCRGAAGGAPYEVRHDGLCSCFPQPTTVSLPWFWLRHRAPWQWWSDSGELAPERSFGPPLASTPARERLSGTCGDASPGRVAEHCDPQLRRWAVAETLPRRTEVRWVPASSIPSSGGGPPCP